MKESNNTEILDALIYLEQLINDKEILSALSQNQAVDFHDRLNHLEYILLHSVILSKEAETTDSFDVAKEKIEGKKASNFDLKRLVSTLDFFRYKRELFSDNTNLIEEISDEISNMQSEEEAKEYLHQRMQWNWETSSVNDFMDVVSIFFKRTDR